MIVEFSSDKMGLPRKWNTNWEMQFISRLGTCANTSKTRLELLKNYRAAIAKRGSWDGIDRVAVRLFLNSQISHAEWA